MLFFDDSGLRGSCAGADDVQPSCSRRCACRAPRPPPARHAHEPADGKKAQRIAYTALFRHTAEDLRPHSNRKFLDSDAVGACDKKVTALVNEHEYSEYKYRKNEIKYSHLFSLCALSAHRS